MRNVIEAFRQNRRIWLFVVLVSWFLIVFAHAPALPIVTGTVLAAIVTSLRAFGHGQKRPWQTGTHR